MSLRFQWIEWTRNDNRMRYVTSAVTAHSQGEPKLLFCAHLEMQTIHSLFVRLLYLCNGHCFFWLPCVFPSVTPFPTFLWGSSPSSNLRPCVYRREDSTQGLRFTAGYTDHILCLYWFRNEHMIHLQRCSKTEGEELFTVALQAYQAWEGNSPGERLCPHYIVWASGSSQSWSLHCFWAMLLWSQ